MEREKLVAFRKLLSRVKFQGSWSIITFEKCADKTDGILKSEGARFYKALIELGYLVKVGRIYRPAFDSKLWHDTDYCLNIIKSILEDQPVIQKRGRVKGKSYAKPITTAVVIAGTKPIDLISSKELVEELRKRGFEVTCKKTVTVIEEL